MVASTKAVPVPALHIPKGNSICQLSIIDTTTRLTVPAKQALGPSRDGHEWLNLPTYSFYIKHEGSNRQLLFDLGCRSDWDRSVPQVEQLISKYINGFGVDKDVSDILDQGNVELDQIEAIVLSHWHFDHCGSLSSYPTSINLVVGPTFRDSFLPGWPMNPASPFHQQDFADRQVFEVDFAQGFSIGGFQAYDYFEDGSLYILNMPGHVAGHIGALVRTTPNTFVLLAGDTCHFPGVIRPSPSIPIPDEISDVTTLSIESPLYCPCPGSLASGEEGLKKTPFYQVPTHPGVIYDDTQAANASARSLMDFDAQPNVLVVISHDQGVSSIFDFFPNGTLNAWKEKRWKELVHWGFVRELPHRGKTTPPVLIDGLYLQGQKLRGLELPE